MRLNTDVAEDEGLDVEMLEEVSPQNASRA